MSASKVYNLIHAVLDAVEEDPRVDAVFVIQQYKNGDAGYTAFCPPEFAAGIPDMMEEALGFFSKVVEGVEVLQ